MSNTEADEPEYRTEADEPLRLLVFSRTYHAQPQREFKEILENKILEINDLKLARDILENIMPAHTIIDLLERRATLVEGYRALFDRYKDIYQKLLDIYQELSDEQKVLESTCEEIEEDEEDPFKNTTTGRDF